MKNLYFLLIILCLGLASCNKEHETAKVLSISLSTTYASLAEGETISLIATISPREARNKKIIWTTSDPYIATVSNGMVTAICEGSATITATSDDGGRTATCSIKVNAKSRPLESISLDATELTMIVGGEKTLTATLFPNNATNTKILWNSSNPEAVTVIDGKMTAVAEGYATITATSEDGTKTASCLVTVIQPAEPLKITATEATTVSIIKIRYPDDISLEYRIGSTEWTDYEIGLKIPLGSGESIQFRAGKDGNSHFSKSPEHYYKFSFSGNGKISATGNIMSLLYGRNEEVQLSEYAFTGLFSNCTYLVDAPELPAISLAEGCYRDMFSWCSSLIDAPELPATNVADNCYNGMFRSCSSLVNAPELPSTILADSCYSNMFSWCTSLVNAPSLPATTIAKNCYYEMFYSCTNLVNAPNLPATVLAEGCYKEMFYSCTNLVNAPNLPATALAEGCYKEMFSRCENLVVAPELPATVLADNCYESMFAYCGRLKNAPTLPAASLARACYGNMFCGCWSLVNVPEISAITFADSSCWYMFAECSALVNAPELHATTVAKSCCRGMFYQCSSLLYASTVLPATTLAESCYEEMFAGTNLITAPDLPATTLADKCYSYMFGGCTSLVDAPALPATTLADGCYSYMFNGCTSLVDAPALPAITLKECCYKGMFMNCSNLSSLKMMAIDISVTDCLYKWVDRVSESGVFTMNKDAKWDASIGSGIPKGWTIIKE